METPDKPAAKAPEAPVADKPTAPAASAGAKKSNKTIWIVVGVVVVVLVVIPAILFTVGAAIIGHKIGTSGVKVNNNTGTVTVKGTNGDEITAGATKTLPKDFPSSVPVYKGSITGSSRVTTDGKVSWTVTIETPDSQSTVASSLTKSFNSNGWTTDMDNQSSDGGLVVAKNSDLQANVYYSNQNDKTSIVYTVGPNTN